MNGGRKKKDVNTKKLIGAKKHIYEDQKCVLQRIFFRGEFFTTFAGINA